MEYILRQIEQKIKKSVEQFPAAVLTGPRQSGKSTLLKKLFADEYNYITFDDPIIREQALSDPRLFLKQAGSKIIIDELQYAPGILSYIKILIDEDRDKKGRFIFTGSQQFNLMKELGDSLAGRIAVFDLLPFNVLEKKNIEHLKTSFISSANYFIHACLQGSYPELAVNNTIDFSLWYGSYFQTYLERDVRTLYDIGNLRDFQAFVQLLAINTSGVLNLSALAKHVGVSVPTIKRWVSVLEAGGIIYLLPPYYNNLGKRYIKSPKIYFLDTGFVCYLTGIKDKHHLLQGPMAGALFENFCVQETIKYIINKGERLSLYFYSNQNDMEVDLIIEDGYKKIFPIEIKLNSTPKKSMISNLKKFKKLYADFDIQNLRVISLCDKDVYFEEDIFFQTLDNYFNWLERK